MKIIVTSIFVQDQDKALKFYTEKLGFIKKEDVPMGKFRWITLVSPDDQDGTELLLEPNEHPAAKEYQKKIFSATGHNVWRCRYSKRVQPIKGKRRDVYDGTDKNGRSHNSCLRRYMR